MNNVGQKRHDEGEADGRDKQCTSGLEFVGDRNKAFYNDGKKGTAGANDFAYILDFNAAQGDQIQLHGRASDYRLGSISLGSEKAVAIYLQQEGQDELVAALRGNGGFNLQSSAARFVS